MPTPEACERQMAAHPQDLGALVGAEHVVDDERPPSCAVPIQTDSPLRAARVSALCRERARSSFTSR
ncbi:hypothetical protein [Streptomyces sp. KL116D]|uniref:hypothetical protein n=1 Tax=Streptomyces sp. KL116D TaxID=3045152 RepID=UPI0035590513